MKSLLATMLLVLSFNVSASVDDELASILNSTYNKVMAEVGAITTEEEAKLLVHKHFIPVIHTRGVAKLVLGRHWRKATVSQRERFTNAFQQMLVNTYSKFLLGESAKGVEFRIVKVQAGRKDKLKTVHTIFKTPSVSLPVHYKFVRSKGGWLVYDILIDGISLITNFRTTYSQEINRVGIEKLIETLEIKVNS